MHRVVSKKVLTGAVHTSVLIHLSSNLTAWRQVSLFSGQRIEGMGWMGGGGS